MSFSITFEWKDQVEDSLTLDYKDRPRYQGADFANHEYKISESKSAAGFIATCNEKGHSSDVRVKGSPFKTLDEAKSGVSEHAVRLIDAKFSALNKSRSYANSLKMRINELKDEVEQLEGEAEDSKKQTYTAARNIRERITFFSETPVNAINEFLRDQTVEEIQL